MELLEKKTSIAPPRVKEEDAFDKSFKPVGATAFFIALVILGLIIWYGIYFLMLERV
jgi:hypothetical protein